MKILFLNPPFRGSFSRASRSPAVTKGGTLYYPIWLAYAAGASEKHGHEVRLIDAPAQKLDLAGVISLVKVYAPRLIVLDSSTPSIYNDLAIVENLKQAFPDMFIVLVGTHPSALPKETLSLAPSLDAIALGEYDYTISDLADCLEKNQCLSGVDGLVFTRQGEIVKNRERAKIESLDDLPFVSSVYKKHLNYKDYFFAAANYPFVMIITGRGCPFRCFFCVYPQVFHSRRYRCRSVENVVAEFEYIAENFGQIKEVGIEDDCFTADKNRVREFCLLLLKKNIKLKWYCNVRGDLDYSLLKLMKEAGCRLIIAGFESGSQEILDNIKKGETVEHYIHFMRDAKRAKLLVHGCMMAGNPGETRQTLAQSYKFAEKLNCDSMQFYPLYVYPGTEAYQWAKSSGYLSTEDFSQWLTKDGLHNCVLNLPGLSSEELDGLCDHYLKKFHLRPSFVFKKICQAMGDSSEGYRILKSAKVFFKKMIQVNSKR